MERGWRRTEAARQGRRSIPRSPGHERYRAARPRDSGSIEVRTGRFVRRRAKSQSPQSIGRPARKERLQPKQERLRRQQREGNRLERKGFGTETRQHSRFGLGHHASPRRFDLERFADPCQRTTDISSWARPSEGVTPNHWTRRRVKWAWSANPPAAAASAKSSARSFSKSLSATGRDKR